MFSRLLTTQGNENTGTFCCVRWIDASAALRMFHPHYTSNATDSCMPGKSLDQEMFMEDAVVLRLEIHWLCKTSMYARRNLELSPCCAQVLEKCSLHCLKRIAINAMSAHRNCLVHFRQTQCSCRVD